LEDGPAVGLLEAMTYGLPIAASDVATHRDRLTDGVDGIVYERRNVDALAAALTRILTDDASTRSLGASARRRTAIDFSFERMVDSYETLLDELTNKAVARAAG
jgi:glycosyltransferase involved in cell wall biosynthesis